MKKLSRAVKKRCRLVVPQWKPVNLEPYNRSYEVSDHGQVRKIAEELRSQGTQGKSKHVPHPRQWTRYIAKLETPRLLRAHLVGKGYPIVALHHRGEELRIYVHRLVALTFVPNPDGKPFVNHKDGCKSNNRATNLEWVTMDENNAHSIDNGLGQSLTEAPYRTGARSPVCT